MLQAAVREGVNLRRVGDTRIGITYDEMHPPRHPPRRSGAPSASSGATTISLAHHYRLPGQLARQSDYLTHPVFHMNRAETEMMRYMRRLSDRDLALDRAMIPLGSCTMKLNARPR